MIWKVTATLSIAAVLIGQVYTINLIYSTQRQLSFIEKGKHLVNVDGTLERIERKLQAAGIIGMIEANAGAP